jgi:hypothetical protein
VKCTIQFLAVLQHTHPIVHMQKSIHGGLHAFQVESKATMICLDRDAALLNIDHSSIS